jgi:hypothetical protein
LLNPLILPFFLLVFSARTSKASAKVIKKGESIYIMYCIYVKKVLKNINYILYCTECV